MAAATAGPALGMPQAVIAVISDRSDGGIRDGVPIVIVVFLTGDRQEEDDVMWKEYHIIHFLLYLKKLYLMYDLKVIGKQLIQCALKYNRAVHVTRELILS